MSRAGPWLVHLYTASGAVLALLALDGIVGNRYRDAFVWLTIAAIVDATDGVLARLADVGARLPWFNGSKLDDIVDYLTYVFVPAFLVWHAELVPPGWAPPVAAAILLSSAYGFNRADAKTADHYFTGFPSYWNVVVFYLYIARSGPAINAAVLLMLAALVFAPIRCIYPSRTPVWRRTTIVLGVIWGVALLAMVWRMPDVPGVLFWPSLIFPVYYIALSLALELRRRTRRVP